MRRPRAPGRAWRRERGLARLPEHLQQQRQLLHHRIAQPVDGGGQRRELRRLQGSEGEQRTGPAPGGERAVQGGQRSQGPYETGVAEPVQYAGDVIGHEQRGVRLAQHPGPLQQRVPPLERVPGRVGRAEPEQLPYERGPMAPEEGGPPVRGGGLQGLSQLRLPAVPLLHERAAYVVEDQLAVAARRLEGVVEVPISGKAVGGQLAREAAPVLALGGEPGGGPDGHGLVGGQRSADGRPGREPHGVLTLLSGRYGGPGPGPYGQGAVGCARQGEGVGQRAEDHGLLAPIGEQRHSGGEPALRAPRPGVVDGLDGGTPGGGGGDGGHGRPQPLAHAQGALEALLRGTGGVVERDRTVSALVSTPVAVDPCPVGEPVGGRHPDAVEPYLYVVERQGVQRDRIRQLHAGKRPLGVGQADHEGEDPTVCPVDEEPGQDHARLLDAPRTGAPELGGARPGGVQDERAVGRVEVGARSGVEVAVGLPDLGDQVDALGPAFPQGRQPGLQPGLIHGEFGEGTQAEQMVDQPRQAEGGVGDGGMGVDGGEPRRVVEDPVPGRQRVGQ
ncbi:hypothetical protein ABMX48_25000 [Streptomyces cavourensis]